MMSMMSSMTKSYSELIQIPTFIERFRYLKLGGVVGEETFGYDRMLNQILYNSYEWKQARNSVIVRDCGCDLGIEGREIQGQILVHHINPITLQDIDRRSDILLDPENLITTMLMTHNAIHYGDESLLMCDPIVRTRNDMCPWRN